VAGFGFDSHLNDTFTLRGGFRYGTMWRHYGYIAATLTDNAGNYTEKYTTSPTQTEYTRSEYALLDARIPTWTFVHNLTMGFTGTDYLYSRGADVSSGLYKSRIDSPITFAQPNLTLGGLNQWQQQIFTNLLIADRLEVTDKLSLLGGVNYAEIQQRAWGSGVVISTANYTAGGLTPTAGFTYKILPNVVGYASYMQSLQNGDTAPSTAANAYAVLAPSVSQQYETGLKTTLGEVNLNVALFRINKVNAELNPNNNIYMQDGREIHQGVEVTFSGNLMDGLNAVGGFTLMHAYVDQATALPLTVGKTPVNVPEEQVRLRLEYALPFASDVKLSFGPNFLGRRPIDVYDQQYIKPATLFDGGIRYESEAFGHKVYANLTLDNVFNQAYWAYYRSGDGLLLGNPRTVALTVKATW
jgi:iron complex outermembrane receptor protein